jgi:transcriptional regulator with XRE-family HTH domain
VTTDDGAPRSRIGRRLRAEREAQLLTLEQVANACGLTKGFLSKVERDQAAPSVASLLRLCEVLGVSIGELFDASDEHALVRAGAYPGISFGGEAMDEALLTPRRERRLQVIHSVIHPGGGSGDEAYGLPVDVEFAYVLEGVLEITLEGTRHALHQGDAFTFSPQAAHAFRNPSAAGMTRVLWVLCPALPADGSRRDPEAEGA